MHCGTKLTNKDFVGINDVNNEQMAKNREQFLLKMKAIFYYCIILLANLECIIYSFADLKAFLL